MGYYIRVLGTKDPNIHVDELISTLKNDGLLAKFLLNPDEQPNKWSILSVQNNDGQELAQIERNPVIDGELGKEELEEFKTIVSEFKPTSAANWLIDFFDKVKVIYAFQLLNASFTDSGFAIISSLKTTIWNNTSGILQADNEGFSNEEGFHILWQFSDDVKGDWSCAILNENKQWENFVMDLGDKTQREEFMNGQIPNEAGLL